MSRIVVGLDFGTSNTSVSYADLDGDRRVHSVTVETSDDGTQNYKSIPSAMFFIPSEKRLLIGKHAISAYRSNDYDGRLLRNLKSILDRVDDTTVIEDMHIPYFQFIYNFLNRIKKRIIAEAGSDNFVGIVVGRPVHFFDFPPKIDGVDNTKALQTAQERDNTAQINLRRIVERLGFTNIEFMAEPIAASFALERKLNQDSLAFIADIGGGTSDFAAVQLGPSYATKTDRTSDVLATTGIKVGGTDFDKSFSMSCFMSDFGAASPIQLEGGDIGIFPSVYFDKLSNAFTVNDLYNTTLKSSLHDDALSALHLPKIERLIQVVKYELGHNIINEIEVCKKQLSFNPDVEWNIKNVDVRMPDNDDAERAIRAACAAYNSEVDKLAIYTQNLSQQFENLKRMILANMDSVFQDWVLAKAKSTGVKNTRVEKMIQFATRNHNYFNRDVIADWVMDCWVSKNSKNLVRIESSLKNMQCVNPENVYDTVYHALCDYRDRVQKMTLDDLRARHCTNVARQINDMLYSALNNFNTSDSGALEFKIPELMSDRQVLNRNSRGGKLGGGDVFNVTQYNSNGHDILDDMFSFNLNMLEDLVHATNEEDADREFLERKKLKNIADSLVSQLKCSFAVYPGHSILHNGNDAATQITDGAGLVGISNSIVRGLYSEQIHNLDCENDVLPIAREIGLIYEPRRIARTDFEKSATGWLDRIKASVNECIAASGRPKSDFKQLIMTGGTARIPAVRAAICSCFDPDINLVSESFDAKQLNDSDIENMDTPDDISVGLCLHALNIFK